MLQKYEVDPLLLLQILLSAPYVAERVVHELGISSSPECDGLQQ